MKPFHWLAHSRTLRFFSLYTVIFPCARFTPGPRNGCYRSDQGDDRKLIRAYDGSGFSGDPVWDHLETLCEFQQSKFRGISEFIQLPRALGMSQALAVLHPNIFLNPVLAAPALHTTESDLSYLLAVLLFMLGIGGKAP